MVLLLNVIKYIFFMWSLVSECREIANTKVKLPGWDFLGSVVPVVEADRLHLHL